MPLDPSIIMSGNKSLADLANTVGSFGEDIQRGKLLKMQTQNQQQQLADQQGLRQAYAGATATDANGNVSVDQGKVLSNLASNPATAHMVPQVQAQIAQNQFAVQQHKMELANMKMDFAGKTLGGAKTQDEWSRGLGALKAAGYDVSDIPQQFTPQARDYFVAQTMSVKDRLANQIAQQNAQSEALKAKAAAFEAGLPVSGIGGGAASPGGKGPAPQIPGAPFPGFNPSPKMQMKALEDYNQAVESSRQAPDAAQELKNVMFAKNLNEITKIAPGGDLNKLNPQQMKLAITELVKMAGGSVPTEGELDQMTPDTYAQKYAGLMQKITGKSQPANAGEFIQQALDYASGIGKVSKQSLMKREGQIADRFRPWLGEGQYKTLRGQTADRYGDEKAPPHGQTVQQKDASGNVHTYTWNPSTGQYE